jgi:Maf-like protein
MMVEITASPIEGSSRLDVVLASETKSRRKLLKAAGIAFRIVEPDVDEAAIHEALLKDNGEMDPGDVAELLARAKAEEVSARFPGALVIGPIRHSHSTGSYSTSRRIAAPSATLCSRCEARRISSTRRSRSPKEGKSPGPTSRQPI